MTNEDRKTPLLGMTLGELKDVAVAAGLPPYAGKQLARWLYVKGAEDIDEMSDISLENRRRLKEKCMVGRMRPAERMCSADGTVKYLFPVRTTRESGGDRFVETVFIPDGDRGTLCVSCQVGCRMGCLFCQTGKQGFGGQLTVGDIVNQVYAVPEHDRLTNVVYMGQGEPADNLDNVLRSTELLMAPYGMAWSPRRITISTAGLEKGLRRLLDESPCHVAVSLHSPIPEQRAMLMPAERAYSLTEVIGLLRQYDFSHQRRLSFEYTVFGGLNDSNVHLRELVKLLKGLECRVNLIRFHHIPGTQLQTSNEERMVQMRDYLTRNGITTTIRASRGEDILAACGLLNTARMQQAQKEMSAT